MTATAPAALSSRSSIPPLLPVHQLCLWSFTLSFVCGLSSSALFVVFQPQLCLWSFTLSFVCGLSTSALFVAFHHQLCLWSFNLSFVCGLSPSALFVVFQPQLCLWPFIISFVCGLSTSALFVAFHHQLCLWPFIINFVCGLSSSTLSVAFHHQLCLWPFIINFVCGLSSPSALSVYAQVDIRHFSRQCLRQRRVVGPATWSVVFHESPHFLTAEIDGTSKSTEQFTETSSLIFAGTLALMFGLRPNNMFWVCRLRFANSTAAAFISASYRPYWPALPTFQPLPLIPGTAKNDRLPGWSTGRTLNTSPLCTPCPRPSPPPVKLRGTSPVNIRVTSSIISEGNPPGKATRIVCCTRKRRDWRPQTTDDCACPSV